MLRYSVRLRAALGGWTGVGDEDRGRELPQRVPGAARVAPGARDPGGEVTSPSLRSGIRAGRSAKANRAAEQVRAAEPVRAASAGLALNAGPVVEDEVTEWLGPAGQSPSAESRPAAPGPAGGPGIRLTVLVVVAALVVGLLAVVTVRRLARPPASAAGAALARQQAAARDETAAWVAQQVSHDVTVSCDQVMCAALAAHGFPSRELLVLGPLSPDPVTSGVVVETAAVRSLFGTSLAMAWAPAVLAAFGSGPAAITVRVMAPHGAAAYQTALAADLAARKTAGAALLRDQRITVLAPAAGQLAAGLADVRLLRALTALARHEPVSIVDFGNSGASAGIPLRYADLAETDPAARQPGAAYVRSVRAYLSAASPARVTTATLLDGQPVLRVEVTAPSPLAVSSAQRSP